MIFLNKQRVEFGSFPNGESCLPIEGLYFRSYNRVIWQYESEKEIVQLAILKKHLDKIVSKAELKICYMPHSRMDRSNGIYAFSLPAITGLINHMGWKHIQVVEPHSDVTPALLDNSQQINWCQDNLDHVVELIGAKSLFYPDAGAQKRYAFKMPSAVGIKHRDFATGEITAFSYSGAISTNVLIVDDMCSKGGTFVHSAKLLRQYGAKKVFLMVAYCENTVFEGELFEHIDGIFLSMDNNMKKSNKKLHLI